MLYMAHRLQTNRSWQIHAPVYFSHDQSVRRFPWLALIWLRCCTQTSRYKSAKVAGSHDDKEFVWQQSSLIHSFQYGSAWRWPPSLCNDHSFTPSSLSSVDTGSLSCFLCACVPQWTKLALQHQSTFTYSSSFQWLRTKVRTCCKPHRLPVPAQLLLCLLLNLPCRYSLLCVVLSQRLAAPLRFISLHLSNQLSFCINTLFSEPKPDRRWTIIPLFSNPIHTFDNCLSHVSCPLKWACGSITFCNSSVWSLYSFS